MTGCRVFVRGQFVETGKKPPAGHKKLHLYIQGNSRNEVTNAYKEIQRLLEENALMYYTASESDFKTGSIARFQI